MAASVGRQPPRQALESRVAGVLAGVMMPVSIGCSAVASTSGLPVRTDLYAGVRVLAAESTDGAQRNAVAAVGDHESLGDAWTCFGLTGRPPGVDFEQEVVLIYAAAHADCPHAVVSLTTVRPCLHSGA